MRMGSNRANPPRGPAKYDYFVHFLDADNRYDAWVSYAELRELTKEELSAHFNRKRPAGEEQKERDYPSRPKTVSKILFAGCTMDTWYYSPVPKCYEGLDPVAICEGCLMFMRERELTEHLKVCTTL